MINNISEKIVSSMIKNGMATKEDKDVYIYHLLCIIETGITVLSMLVLGIISKQFINVILFIIFFFALRNRIGGFHLGTYLQCYIGTMCVLVGVIAAAKYLKNYIIQLNIITIAAVIFILMIGALNHPNMNFTREEFEASKKLGRRNMFIEAFIIIFLNVIKAMPMPIIYMELAVCVSAVLLLLAIVSKQYIN